MLNSSFIMLCVCPRNLLVRAAFKMVPLELAMVFFGLSFLGGPP